MKKRPDMYPHLTKSYKKTFSFKLATTSFIYPDTYCANAEILAPFVDEIELLLLQGAPSDRPAKSEIEQLHRIGRQANLTYNVHLPMDVQFGHPDKKVRQRAIRVIREVVDLVAVLAPTTHTLHLNRHGTDTSQTAVKQWQRRIEQSLTALFDQGVDPHALTVETLTDPFEWVEPIVRAYDLNICLDIGHLLLNGILPGRLVEQYAERIPLIHLHGVREGRDHLALTEMAPEFIDPVFTLLNDYQGTVSVEVFSFSALASSLDCLDRRLLSASRPGT